MYMCYADIKEVNMAKMSIIMYAIDHDGYKLLVGYVKICCDEYLLRWQ